MDVKPSTVGGGGCLQLTLPYLRKRGWVFTPSVIRGYATPPKLTPFPLGWGESVQTWPQQMGLWAGYGLPPNQARDDWMIFRTATRFDFLVDKLFSFSLVYFCLDLR